MVISVDVDLEQALKEQARQKGIDPEALALQALRDRFISRPAPFEPRDEWERILLQVGKDCGVALPDSAVSSEGLYD